MAKFRRHKGAEILAGVVTVTYDPPVDVDVRVVNRGQCDLTIQLWIGQAVNDLKTIRAPAALGQGHAGVIQGEAITRVTISCGQGAGECMFDYTITVS